MFDTQRNKVNRLPFFALVLFAFLVGASGCSTVSTVDRAKSHIAEEEWLQAVIEYRSAYNRDPDNIEIKSRLHQTELRAADYYYQRGHALMEQGHLDGAIGLFQQGLVAKPDHDKVQQAMASALARRESDQIVLDAKRAFDLGRHGDVTTLLERALEIYPDNQAAQNMLARIEAEEQAQVESGLALMSEERISLNFRRTDLKTAFEFIAESFGINVIFDDAIKSSPVVLFADDVTFYQALNLLLTTSKTFYKEIGRNTILIAPDTEEKRGQYEEYIIRIFHLRDIKAADMAALIKGLVKVDKVVVNEQLNSITVRESARVLDLVEKLVLLNDRRPAEMILDVELLEVDHQKATQIGLDYGQQMTLTFPQWPVSDSLRSVLRQGVVTLPAITFRYFKQDVDAQVLSNPKIRVMNGKSATIHIGDRVPLRSATIQDATGQTRTTFEYRDIGIKLVAVPQIHLDNSVTVKLSLEVSSLGSNVGTQDEPAFSIGTRNADTHMLLRDGETAILGGLISEADRSSQIRVPGLGSIPAVGSLFTTYDDSDQRTDVLLTITPRIVRAWELPKEAERSFFSGTQESYANQPLFAFLEKHASSDARPTIRLDSGAAVAATSAAEAPLSLPSSSLALAESRVPQTPERALHVAFDAPSYSVDQAAEVEVGLIVDQGPATGDMTTEVLFNPSVVQYVGQGGSSETSVVIDDGDAEKGVIRVQSGGFGAAEQGSPLLITTLAFRGKASGISYLAHRSADANSENGDKVVVQTSASRINVK